MQSSARVQAALKSSLNQSTVEKTAKKFTLETVTHTNSVVEIFNLLNECNNYSDHLPIMHKEAITATWNTLKQCHVEMNNTGTVVKKTNNGFNRSEELAQYQARLANNLTEIGRLAALHNSDLANIPVSVLCLQEVTTNALNSTIIDTHLRGHGFTTRCNIEKNDKHLIQECAEKKDEILVMAYDYKKVTYLESCSIPHHLISEIQAREARFQAAKFLDKTTQQEFVIVNVHQNWGAVNNPDDIEPFASHDVKRIAEYFQNLNLPCIITGDFNTTNIPLPNENGKIIIGKNANMCWNFKTAMHQLDSCDHIVMNEKYCHEFLPVLIEQLRTLQNAKSMAMGAPTVTDLLTTDDLTTEKHLSLRF